MDPQEVLAALPVERRIALRKRAHLLGLTDEEALADAVNAAARLFALHDEGYEIVIPPKGQLLKRRRRVAFQ